MIVDAAEDLLRTEQLSEAHIVVLKNVCVHLNQVLDTQMLFIDNMSLWFNTNVHRFMSYSAVAKSLVGEPTKAIDGVLNGIKALWDVEATMQEGQEHIEAVSQGLVQRLPAIEPGTLSHSQSVPPSPSRRVTGKIPLGQSTRDALIVEESIFETADLESGRLLTDDRNSAASPTVLAESSSSPLVSSPDFIHLAPEGQELVHEVPFRKSWGKVADDKISSALRQCRDFLKLVVIGKALQSRTLACANSVAAAAMEEAKEAGKSWTRLLEPWYARLSKIFAASVRFTDSVLNEEPQSFQVVLIGENIGRR